MEMSTVLCFCAWQRAAKEQRAQPITSRSKQAFLVRLRHWSESSPKVMKLSNRFLSLHITFSLVYHSRWANARVLCPSGFYRYIYTHIHPHTHIDEQIEKLSRVLTSNWYNRFSPFRVLSNEINHWKMIEYRRRITISAWYLLDLQLVFLLPPSYFINKQILVAHRHWSAR